MNVQLRTTKPDNPLDWPPTVDLYPTAAQALGLGRTAAYELARRGEFPVPVLRLGRSLKVTRASMLRYLDLDEAARPASKSA